MDESDYYSRIVVPAKKEDLSIEGIPEDIVEVGTTLTLTCTINRIKPEAEIYWLINGRRENGSVPKEFNSGGFKQINSLLYTYVYKSCYRVGTDSSEKRK